MKRTSRILAVVLVIAMLLPGVVQAAPKAKEVKVERISGNNRVETAINVSQKTHRKFKFSMSLL